MYLKIELRILHNALANNLISKTYQVSDAFDTVLRCPVFLKRDFDRTVNFF